MKKLVEKQLNGLTTHLECAVTGEEAAALVVLRGCRMGVVELACLCKEMEEMVDGIDGKEVSMESLRALVRAGREVLGRRGGERVSFAEAVEATLEAKKGRSPRTLQDIAQTMRALMAVDEGLASRPICELRREDCVRLLQAAYAHSPSRFVKARANLSGVFSVACQRGWCEENPVRYVPVPVLREKTIEPLRLPEIKRLVNVARRESFRDCLPALALMLYAGCVPRS